MTPNLKRKLFFDTTSESTAPANVQIFTPPSPSITKPNYLFETHSSPFPIKCPCVQRNLSTESNQCLTPFSAGCTWSPNNWSCAYDSVLMSVFYAYLPLSDCIKQRWRQETPLSHALTLSFEHLISMKDNLMSSSHFNIVRDQMRDYLSNINASYFPRYGTVGAPAELILTYLKEKESPKFCITSPCSSSVSSSTDSVLLSTNDYMPTIFFSSLWTKFCSTTTDNPPPKTASTQDWIDLIFKGKEKERSHSSTSHCLNCSPATPCHTSNIYFDHAPPFLTFEIAPHTIPLHTPSIKLYIKTSPSQPLTEYQFRAVIYHGD